jgi:hypothetical protein
MSLPDLSPSSGLRRSRAAVLGVSLFAIGALLVPATVAAHNPNASLTCQDGQPVLNIDLTDYNDQVKNTVSAAIDGNLVLDVTTFASSYANAFSAGSPFAGHTAQVVVIAGDDPTAAKGWSAVINLGLDPCQQPTPPPTPTATPTPSSTATATPTPTPTATPTPSSTATATPTPTPTATATPSSTATATPTPTPTATSTPKPSESAPPSPTGSALPSQSASATPTGSADAASGTPKVTPPATNTGGPAGGSGTAGLLLALALMGLATTGILVLVPNPVNRRRR